MADVKLEDLVLRDEAGLNNAMRAEAATRAQSSNNWTMAALITANGGAAAGLLSNSESGVARIVAMALFVLGVTAALVAGRLTANLAHHTESLFVSLVHLDKYAVHQVRLAQTGDKKLMLSGNESWKKAMQKVDEERADLDRAALPDPWLGIGVICFFFGCIAAGLALF